MVGGHWLRRPALVVTAFLVLVTGQVGADNEAVEARMRRDITFLASDECEGRGPGTKGIDKAAEYIAREFQKAGLQPGGPQASWFQPFQILGSAQLDGPSTLRLRGPLGQQIELR